MVLNQETSSQGHSIFAEPSRLFSTSSRSSHISPCIGNQHKLCSSRQNKGSMPRTFVQYTLDAGQLPCPLPLRLARLGGFLIEGTQGFFLKGQGLREGLSLSSSISGGVILLEQAIQSLEGELLLQLPDLHHTSDE